ncbi:TonB-dependent siderophore receptor [Pseudoroseomonas rhizosphaerae]|uniref:TonB-dependent siderophore receptor n=1 Tax=Teichococcus rhizosphaerae TaxID=1335062 RepID=A0A2C7AED1_9PROT|nr:TonB-dependent siderophore receptor [Pseudoroseomonas rhizosphaerae]PHK96429.1 TonB-dependent siderophore receptor [Pseudoroseomonas rhizosphaerae]
MTLQSGHKASTSHAAWMASLAMGLPGAALAQGAAAPDGGVTLPTVDVQGTAPANTLQRAAPVGRLPGAVQDTPQTINVIPREVLEQQNVTTLEQALRNVPGITASIGEGNGGVSGDQFRIRGFSAQNDIYVDGLRDFGAYQRDAFTYEDVAVLKGPSGFALGTGSVGGGVAVNTRLPRLGNSYSATATGGMGPFARGTVDINQQIGETTALRLNLMGQSSEVVGRDNVDSRKWGIAPSIAFGLGTDTTFSLHYLHYEYDNATDAGVPVITLPGRTVARPATEYGLPRSTYYGVSGDRDKVTVDQVTARLSHQVSDWLTLANDTRVGFYDRDYAFSPVSCAAACATSFLNGGNPAIGYTGGNSPYSQSSWSVQNISTATARFTTGPLRHELVGGIDVWHEEIDRSGYSYATARSGTIYGGISDVALPVNPRSTNSRETDTTAFGLFLNERVWLTPQLSLIGGLRWTRYQVDYEAGTPGAAPSTDISKSVNVVDPRASIVFEPARGQTFYATYSTSSTPPGSYFSTFPAAVNSFNADLDPERNTLYEVGAKLSFLGERLGLYGALYRIDKSNATEFDAVSNTISQTSDEQRNQGIEIGVTGQVTPAWTINANYTAMDSETRKSTNAANVGKRVQYVPEHAASVWTTYEFNREQPWNLTVGAGATYRGQVYLNADNTAEAPSGLAFDALVSHRINDNLRVQVNGYNLGNALNYEAMFGNRVVPSAGRTVLFTLAADF